MLVEKNYINILYFFLMIIKDYISVKNILVLEKLLINVNFKIFEVEFLKLCFE